MKRWQSTLQASWDIWAQHIPHLSMYYSKTIYQVPEKLLVWFDLKTRESSITGSSYCTPCSAKRHMIQQIQWAWSVVANRDAVEKLCQSLKADSQQRPLGFWSKALSCSVDNYSSFERMKKRKALGFLEIVFWNWQLFSEMDLGLLLRLIREAEWCKAY